MAGLPSVSIVVPVRHGGAAFARCLSALARLQPRPAEVIVVADGAEPDDVAQAARSGARVVEVTQARGPAHARNRGAEVARGDVLFFVDADCEAYPDAVGRVRALLAPGGPDAVIGSYDAEPGARDFLSQYRNLLHHYTHQLARPEANTFWGACGGIRRAAFEAVGGFDERFPVPSIEDIEFGYRLRAQGYRIALDKALRVKHLKRWRAADMLRTDLLRRARPWARLLLQSRSLPNDLNTRTSERLSVALVGLALGALTVAPWRRRAAALGAASALGAVGLNADFYAFLARERSPAFAVAAVPWHLAYFACAGGGLLLAAADVFRTRSLYPRNAHPSS